MHGPDTTYKEVMSKLCRDLQARSGSQRDYAVEVEASIHLDALEESNPVDAEREMKKKGIPTSSLDISLQSASFRRQLIFCFFLRPYWPDSQTFFTV